MKNGFNKKGLCRLCKETRTLEGHDPCIANLPGVQFACCGHGIEAGYIKFKDGRCLNFFPCSVDLYPPLHEMIDKGAPKGERVSPMFTCNETYWQLDFTKRKVVQKIGSLTPISVQGRPVKVRVRKQSK